MAAYWPSPLDQPCGSRVWLNVSQDMEKCMHEEYPPQQHSIASPRQTATNGTPGAANSSRRCVGEGCEACDTRSTPAVSPQCLVRRRPRSGIFVVVRGPAALRGARQKLRPRSPEQAAPERQEGAATQQVRQERPTHACDQQLRDHRYQYRSPKYYRGPLHPHQPPPVSDPASRLFQPGPFSLPRLEQTYQSTIASDLLALTYQHYPPGYRAPKNEQRLREWTGDSPYYKNRPLRGPRGKGEVLRLLNEPRTFRNIPKITKVVVHSMVPEAQENSANLHVAGMILQAITNVRAESHKARHNVVGWGLREGRYVSVTSTLKHDDALDFIAKLIDVVLPKIKEWKGTPGSSGDGHGNISFGLTPDQLALFPEIEVNYDAYVQYRLT
jgi:large subunit ribosomal protein L5